MCIALTTIGIILGSIAFLGILGEIGWYLDDYTRDPSSSFLKGEAEGNK
ncbi:hypothetical protein SCRES2_gp16 [Synechococcus phage S-CRES2]|nr:hypothetical protein SCRES2_gp16 [Synechococcus phage S-CRES2]